MRSRLLKQRLRWAVIGLMLFAFQIAGAAVPPELLIHGHPPVELTESARVFVEMETRHNPAGKRSNQPFWIEHLEIPLKALGEDGAENLDPKIRDSMVFMKNGEPYVRWILNPEDTTYGKQLEAKLTEQGVSFTRARHYVGYLTSSRSCIVQDPATGVIFSIKSSTNQTGGMWRDKKETVRAAKAGRRLSDYLSRNFSHDENKTLRITPEPLMFAHEGADQAIIVRQFDQFNDPNSERVLITMFAALEKNLGKKIAELNGSNDPYDYWRKNAIEPTGAALAELMMNFGLEYNSPHGQNFAIEVDRNWKPTGRIFIRDYADANVQTEIMAARGGHEVIELYKAFEQNVKFTGKIIGNFNPFWGWSPDGSSIPEWVESLHSYAKSFSTSFQKRVLEMLKSPSNPNPAFVRGWGDINDDGYWKTIARYNVETDSMMKRWLTVLRVRSNAKLRNSCTAIFAERPQQAGAR